MVVDLIVGESLCIGRWIFYVAPGLVLGSQHFYSRYCLVFRPRVVGVFGEDPGNETNMKELRDDEPNLEANILNKQDATERDDDNEEEDQKPADYDV